MDSRLLFVFALAWIHLMVVDARIPEEPAVPNQMVTTESMVTASTQPTPELHHPPQNGPCFYAEPELCQSPLIDDPKLQVPNCECRLHPTIPQSLICCNVTSLTNITSCQEPDPSEHWKNIHVRNASLDELDISNGFWKLFESISITDGTLKRITREFTRFSATKCFNVSNNTIMEIQPRVFRNLMQLQVLDISFNNLSTIPNINKLTNLTMLTIDIRGNKDMLCKSVSETIDRGGLELNFVEPDKTYCLTNQTFNWFNSTDNVPLRQLYRMKQLQSECPSDCKCEVERMNYEQQSPENGTPLLIFSAKVDCSNRHLTELPQKLPTNTYSLNVSCNNITSLSALNDNPTYQQIIRLYADNNQISSLLDLEGTTFIEEFEVLSLRKNKLKSIPIYLLSNTLDKNPRGKMLYFEGNKLHCDCNSAKILRLWLLARQNHIKDWDQILCENMPQIVVDLSEMKLCQSQHDWTDYIYYLIAAEIFLLGALVFKVSYDYWVFKTAGYLPWPASKMPKLPCDWLCES
ncbi:protein halfway [Lutzomyia longipalpis]|uniref:protein halfway n=1 Tax=Lutzomyia longipalpis TaxID=7200 RepID=UPI0024846508|nr:protein halfway [Lutzomyia longipalpis]